ncbi:MAG: Uma2 family endonuclease, partial [Prochlorotrichaceae cyanobacterium]
QLGIGYERGINGGWERDWLYWYDSFGNRYATNEEIAQQERDIAQQEREQRQLAEERLAELEARLKAIEENS